MNSVRLKLPSQYTPDGLECGECAVCRESPESPACGECLRSEDRRPVFARLCEVLRPPLPEPTDDVLTLVVDYLPVTGSTCSPEGIGATCVRAGPGEVCAPVLRNCSSVAFGAIETELRAFCAADGDGGSVRRPIELVRPLVDKAHQSVRDELVTTDAPDGAIVVRVTYLSGPKTGLGCEGQPSDVEVELPLTELLGCVYGCPASLDDVRSAVVLEYGPTAPCNENHVARCANLVRPQE